MYYFLLAFVWISFLEGRQFCTSMVEGSEQSYATEGKRERKKERREVK